MIRLILLSTGFIGITAALLWTLGEAPAPAGLSNEVSRAGPAPLALETVAIAPDFEQVRPQARPADLPSLSPAMRTSAFDAVPPTSKPDPVSDAIRAMAMGIVNELQKPAPDAPVQPKLPTAAPALSGQPYTVQPGDSLPGIAFRFYGTTVAYLDILAANQDTLTDPSQLAEGMVLRIPDLP